MENLWTSYQPSSNEKHLLKTKNDFKNITYIYLYDLKTDEQLILNIVPQSVVEAYSPSISSVSPFGTIKPKYFYGGGNDKTISFTISLHEDIHNEDGSIYNIIEKIKNLSKPSINNSNYNTSIKGPLVYMQLGNQFAGTGHINISIEQRKPYDIQTGRFKVVDISITFTYHETYKNLEINEHFRFDYDITKHNNTASGIYKDFLDYTKEHTIQLSTKDLENFLGQALSYVDLGKYVFTDEKIKNFFNVTNKYIKSTIYMDELAERNVELELTALRQSIMSGILADTKNLDSISSLGYTYNPFALDVYNNYVNLLTMLNPSNYYSNSYNKIYQDLSALYKKVLTLKSSLNTSKVVIFNKELLKMRQVLNRSEIEPVILQAIKTSIGIDSYHNSYYPMQHEDSDTFFPAVYELIPDYLGLVNYSKAYSYDQHSETLKNEVKQCLLLLINKVQDYYNNASDTGWYMINGVYYVTSEDDMHSIREVLNTLIDIIKINMYKLEFLYGMGG